jgi:hypothetical protein
MNEKKENMIIFIILGASMILAIYLFINLLEDIDKSNKVIDCEIVNGLCVEQLR